MNIVSVTPRSYELSEKEALMAFKQVSAHCEALKNWTASAVERDDHARAKTLVAELREYQALYAKLNVEAHRFIDQR